MPLKPNLVLADEEEYVFSESTTSMPVVATSEVKTSESKPKSVSEPLIEDWISDSEMRLSLSLNRENLGESPKFSKIDVPPIPKGNFVGQKQPKGNVIPKAVLMKSGIKTLNTVGQNFSKIAVLVNTSILINTTYLRPTVNSARTTSNVFNSAHTHARRPFNKSTTNKNSNLKEKVNTVKGNVTTARPKAVVSENKRNKADAVKASTCWVWRLKQKGNPQLELKEKGVIDNRCFRHMTKNKSNHSDYEEINGGFVAFGRDPKGGRITGKGKISTCKLNFEDVYFVKELNFNLFSVSQMCDKKNSVLFIDNERVILSPDFKLLDENHVLFRVPRKDNMYSVDLKNIVPSGGLTCLFAKLELQKKRVIDSACSRHMTGNKSYLLDYEEIDGGFVAFGGDPKGGKITGKGGLTYLFAKATLDESNLWHRRLGHINFKTMNKLVRENLVRGLPSNIFENNHTCVACQKGKQHRASCKTKIVSSISQPLQMLHMDLFGPTFVKSLMKKMYCLVVTDDYSRVSWVYFLATKDETSEILKTRGGKWVGLGWFGSWVKWVMGPMGQWVKHVMF
ncbi:putative ribonuclease H-like domain-containing protein [Tanacetum coccineum]